MCIITIDNAIEDAWRALATRRAEVQDELARLDRAIGALDRVIDGQSRAAMRQRYPGPGRSVIKPAVLRILREHGDDMHADTILNGVIAAGVPLSANHSKATIVTALRRMVRDGLVAQDGPNLYRLAPEGYAEPEPTEQLAVPG